MTQQIAVSCAGHEDQPAVRGDLIVKGAGLVGARQPVGRAGKDKTGTSAGMPPIAFAGHISSRCGQEDRADEPQAAIRGVTEARRQPLSTRFQTAIFKSW